MCLKKQNRVMWGKNSGRGKGKESMIKQRYIKQAVMRVTCLPLGCKVISLYTKSGKHTKRQ